MLVKNSDPRIEVAAVQLAVELKSRLAAELKLAAMGLADGAEILTADHYRQAIPVALTKLLHSLDTELESASNARRRVA